MELWEIALQEKGLYHIGRSKRDGAPHGSGRYPLGSGDRPYQYKEEAKAEKYRAKQIRKVEKYRQNMTRTYRGVSDEAARNYATAFAKEGKENSETSQHAAKFVLARRIENYINSYSDAEIKKLKSMSIDELKADKEAGLFVDKTVRRVGEQNLERLYKQSHAHALEAKLNLQLGTLDKYDARFKIDKDASKPSGWTDADEKEFKRRRARADAVGDSNFPDKFIREGIVREKKEKEREQMLKQLQKDANVWEKSGRDPEVGQKLSQKYIDYSRKSREEAANSDFDGGSPISKAIASNRKKAQKEYEKFQKNSHKKAYTDPNSNKAYYDLELTPGNTIRASRYQSITGPDNKARLKKGERYTEYKADMKNGTAVGKKLIREATDSKGMGAKTIREEPLTEKDYKYIEDWIRRNK